MTTGMQTVMIPVGDIAAAKQLYGALLGAEPYMDEEYYVGFRANGQDIGLDPGGAAKGLVAPVGYWHVDDIEAKIDELQAAGGAVVQAVTDVGGGKMIALLSDPDGNVVGLLQHPRA